MINAAFVPSSKIYLMNNFFSEGARDNVHEPFIRLKEFLLQKGINLNMFDCYSSYEEIDVHTYERLIKTLPLIDYTKLSKYELEDNTQGKQEIACSGDKCDI